MMKYGMSLRCEIGGEGGLGFSTGELETKASAEFSDAYTLCIFAQRIRQSKKISATMTIFELPHNDVEKEMLGKMFSMDEGRLLGEVTLWADFHGVISVFMPKLAAKKLFCELASELEKLQGKEKTGIVWVDFAAKREAEHAEEARHHPDGSRKVVDTGVDIYTGVRYGGVRYGPVKYNY